MRIVVFGQQAFGKDVFDSLVAAGEEVVGISTPKPREGRTDPLAEAAREKNIPNVFTRQLRKDEGFAEYLSWKPDLLVFAFVTDIVRQNVLDAATHGAIQYHPSLLPLHRGRAAMNWAILAGRQETGLTIFWVDEGIDTGPIIPELLFCPAKRLRKRNQIPLDFFVVQRPAWKRPAALPACGGSVVHHLLQN